MQNKTPEQIKQAVLDHAWQTAMDDGGYLQNLIEWAYRDYTESDYADDYAVMNEGLE